MSTPLVSWLYHLSFDSSLSATLHVLQFFLESSDDSESVSSDSDIGDAGDGVEDVRVLGWEQEEPQGSHRPLGEWEKHTTVREKERHFTILHVVSCCSSHSWHAGIRFQAFGQNGLCSGVSSDVEWDGGRLFIDAPINSKEQVLILVISIIMKISSFLFSFSVKVSERADKDELNQWK